MTAARFLARRALFAVVIVFLVSSASMILARLAPGGITVVDPFGATTAAARLKEEYGLNRPVLAQYADWLAHAARLDFGRSMAYDRPVTDVVPERAKNTAILAFTALLVATLIGLPLGVVTGSRGGPLAGAVRACSVLLLSMPPLLTSLLLVFVAARTGWLPIGGMRSAASAPDDLVDLARHMIVPVVALALPIAALFERLQSQAIAEVCEQPFFAAGLARGVPRRRLVWRDALKASLGPVASVYGIVVGSLLSGSFAVEIVSAWPGLGRLMLDALRARDIYLVAGCAAAGSVFLALGTLVSDVAHAAVDPRIRE